MDRSQAHQKLDASTAVKFVRDIISRFGVPHSIITDNGTNFDSDRFKASVRVKVSEWILLP